MIRFFDILFSAFGIILLSPFLILIWFLIVISSSGSGFFLQKRVGKGGVDFNLIKFRSMHNGSDKKGLITVGARDARITPIGNFIRKFKIDELPQLFNVLKGEMSLVGPRPEVRKYVELYSDEQKQVLNVSPGITDFASLKYANENEILGQVENPEQYYIDTIMPDKINENLYYIQNKSLKLYFQLIFKTIAKIFD